MYLTAIFKYVSKAANLIAVAVKSIFINNHHKSTAV